MKSKKFLKRYTERNRTMNHMKNNNDYFKPIEKGSIEDAAQKIWNKEVELNERIRVDKRTKSVTLDVKKSESGELQRYLNSQRSKEKFEWNSTKDGKIIISPKDAGRATFPKFMIAFMNAKKTGKFGSVKIVSTDEGVEFDEVYTDYKQLAKDIQKEYQKKLRSKKFITTNDIDDYVSTNADSPHKVETDEIIKALKKLRVTVTGKFPHRREEVELDESYWKVSIPDMPPIFIEAGSAGVIKANLRKKLKGDAFKELKIEKVSRGDMIKKYREMAKGDSGGEESSESTIMDEGKALSGKEVAKRMRTMKKYSGMSPFAGKVEKLKTVTRKDLEKILPEYIGGRAITQILEEVELDENFRTLATKGMGTETKANAKVGQELDFYEPKKGDKFLGKIIKTKYGPAGFYQILGLDRQVKGKVFTFKYYDKDKAKNLLKNESKKLVEKGTSPSRYIEILNRLREETEYQKFFMSALKKFGVKSPAELDGEKEKKFYDYVDKNWKAKNEPKEVGEKHKPKQNGKTLTGKPKDKIDVNPQTSDIRAGKY